VTSSPRAFPDMSQAEAALHDRADIVIAAYPGPLVERFTRALAPDRTLWIEPKAAHQLGDVDADSVAVILISGIDCREATLTAALAASRARGWTAFVLADQASLDQRRHWLEAGASAVLSSRLRPEAFATLVRETLAGNLYIAQEASTQEASPALGSLTAREREVLVMVASGTSNQDIARELWLTTPTVKFHLRNIYRKLSVGNRTEAGHLAHIGGLLADA
jgi:DNA-binding NarL/FixJ family response regulator